jgi:hypothetical protein
MEVCIKKDENGQFSVGTHAEAMESGEMKGGGMGMMSGQGGMGEGQESGGMKPAKDLEDALNQARQILSSGEEPSQNDMWNQVQRDRAMANQPGGPMMGR